MRNERYEKIPLTPESSAYLLPHQNATAFPPSHKSNSLAAITLKQAFERTSTVLYLFNQREFGSNQGREGNGGVVGLVDYGPSIPWRHQKTTDRNEIIDE